MIVGAAQVDITPTTTVDLCGFAARTNPMAGVLDPIFAKALYLSDGNEKLLWLNLDVLALSHEFVRDMRNSSRLLGIERVLLSATHTHAAPATIELMGCGERNPEYLKKLHDDCLQAAKTAIARSEDAKLVFTQTELNLAIDRRGKPSAHVDPVLSAVGWKRANGEFVATLANYPMHPVTLGSPNRMVSADWCGATAEQIRQSLPGNPITLVTNGACGNLNPPARPVRPDQMREVGNRVASAIATPLASAYASSESLRIAIDHVDLPLDWVESEEIDRIATARIGEFENTEWAKPFRHAITVWRDRQKALIAAGKGKSIDIELFAVDLGPVMVLAISGELFSRFTALLRERFTKPLFVVGYANAAFGYIATREAYEEGGYEVDQAHFFYNSFRARPGGLEMLAERAVNLLERFATP